MIEQGGSHRFDVIVVKFLHSWPAPLPAVGSISSARGRMEAHLLRSPIPSKYAVRRPVRNLWKQK